MVLFKKNLGLPVGNKKEIKIPQWIMVNERFKVACLRGIFDTDGGLRFTNRNKDEIYRYPQLSLTSYSLSLINDVKIALDELKIKYSNYVEKPNPKKGRPNPIYIIAILGEKRLDQFMKEIGLRNKKHLDKYNFWKKNGYCLPDYLRKNGDGGI